MAVAFNIVLNSTKAPFDPKIETKHLALESEKITKILETLGKPDFDQFISENPDDARAMLAEFGGDDDAEDDGGAELPPEQWFSADEGIVVVKALADHLHANPKSVRDANGVMRELKAMHEVFAKVKAASLKWHFVVDFGDGL